MNIKLLSEHHLEFLSKKGDSTGSSRSTLFKMPHCWKSRVAAHYFLLLMTLNVMRFYVIPTNEYSPLPFCGIPNTRLFRLMHTIAMSVSPSRGGGGGVVFLQRYRIKHISYQCLTICEK